MKAVMALTAMLAAPLAFGLTVGPENFGTGGHFVWRTEPVAIPAVRPDGRAVFDFTWHGPVALSGVTVEGLDAGADDYVVKPFSRSVLVARIAALLRRKAPPANTELDGLVLDDESGTIQLDGVTLTLTKTEHRMLTAFVKHPARVYTRALLSEISTGETGGLDDGGRTVDVQIAGLRKKLGRWAEHVETIRGVGYRVKP